MGFSETCPLPGLEIKRATAPADIVRSRTIGGMRVIKTMVLHFKRDESKLSLE